MGRLQGKSAVITGGSRGIGAATARLFVKEGAGVVIADILEEDGKLLADELKAAGGKTEFVRCDVTKSDEVKNIMTTAVRSFGKLDILFNNAGITQEPTDIANCSEETYDRVMSINTKGCFLGIKHAVPEMLKTGGGSIINTGSTMSVVAIPYASAYCVSKHAVVGLTRLAALDYADKGIRVNVILPGVVDTPIHHQFGQEISPEELEANMKELLSRQPISRMISPDEISPMVLFLASDESCMCTGGIYPVDGGWTTI